MTSSLATKRRKTGDRTQIDVKQIGYTICECNSVAVALNAFNFVRFDVSICTELQSQAGVSRLEGSLDTNQQEDSLWTV